MMCVSLGFGQFLCMSDCFTNDGDIGPPFDARIARIVNGWRLRKVIAGMTTDTRAELARSVGATGTSVTAVVAALSRRIALADRSGEAT